MIGAGGPYPSPEKTKEEALPGHVQPLNKKPQTRIIVGGRWAPAALQGLYCILKSRGSERDQQEL